MAEHPPYDEAAELRLFTRWCCKTCGEQHSSEASAKHCHAADYPCMNADTGCGERARYAYRACGKCSEERSLARWEKMPVVEWDGDALLYSETKDSYFDERPDLGDAEVDSFDALRLVVCEPVKAHMFDVRDWIHDALGDEDDSTGTGADAEKINETVNAYLESLAPLSWTPGIKRPDTSKWAVE